MPEITFEFEIGDIVMVKPMAGSEISYAVEIRHYNGGITADQYRITQRRYVEEVNGVGRVGYSGQLVTDISKNISLPADSIIRVDDYLAKKAIIDSNKPKKNPVGLGAQIFGPATSLTSTLLPGAQAYFDQNYNQASIKNELLKAQVEALKNSL